MDSEDTELQHNLKTFSSHSLCAYVHACSKWFGCTGTTCTLQSWINDLRNVHYQKIVFINVILLYSCLVVWSTKLGRIRRLLKCVIGDLKGMRSSLILFQQLLFTLMRLRLSLRMCLGFSLSIWSPWSTVSRAVPSSLIITCITPPGYIFLL